MRFDYYVPFEARGKVCPGTTAKPLTEETFTALTMMPELADNVKAYQNGDLEAKKRLPAVCWQGVTTNGKRSASVMQPTQYYMVDIDHCKRDPREVWAELSAKLLTMDYDFKIRLVHITPSGKGLRMVARVTMPYPTIAEHQGWLNDTLHLYEYGDFDQCIKDLSRLSFLVPHDYILHYDKTLFTETDEGFQPISKNEALDEHPTGSGVCVQTSHAGNDQHQPTSADSQAEGVACENDGGTDADDAMDITYRGTSVKEIARKYVEVYGEPEAGERHNYYNQMVKYFRLICNNDPRILLHVLPAFGHSREERESQCRSICRTNTMGGSLPKEFYFFLKENGFYQPRDTARSKAEQLAEEEVVEVEERLPEFPPVFKEFLAKAPKDFVTPGVCALMPILGTLTSHVRAKYYFDGAIHSTEFFSIVYAPPGTGKSFVSRMMNPLLKDLRLRDMLTAERENLYNRIVNKKGSNEKSPENPQVTQRMIRAKCSEAEFLTKQKNNKGHHMFTFAAEMDEWKKGSRAAGGNKDDMIRIAWDNGEYGQDFKSTNTFKGAVSLYWNVLITGTVDQLKDYFKNVENGLVTRCGFAPILNQEYAEPPVWKDLNKTEQRVIERFLKRMDEAVYESPLTYDVEDLDMVADEDFDKEVPWKYEFKPTKEVGMAWLKQTILKFLEEQRLLSIKGQDKARDQFRRRVAVRGFRLGMICTQLWEKFTAKEQKIARNFIAWWMQKDIEYICELFGEAVNEKQTEVKKLPQADIFSELSDTFGREDVYVAAKKNSVKTPVKNIVSVWKRAGLIADGKVKYQYIKLKNN